MAATENIDHNFMGNYVQALRDSIQGNIKLISDVTDCQIIKVEKRNKNLHAGDFSIIIPSCAANKHVADAADCRGAALCYKGFEKLFSEPSRWTLLAPFHIERICPIKSGLIFLKLQRSTVYKTVLNDVEQQCQSYGLADRKQTRVVMFNFPYVTDESAFTVFHLRTLLLMEHVGRLFESQGCDVLHVQYQLNPKWKNLVQLLNIKLQSDFGVEMFNGHYNHSPATEMDLLKLLSKTQYLVHKEEQTSANGQANEDDPHNSSQCNVGLDKTSETQHDHSENLVLDLRGFCNAMQLVKGKIGYDKNMHLADFSPHTERFKLLSHLEHHRLLMKPRNPDLVIHFHPKQKAFQQQQVDLGWQMVLGASDVDIHQAHVVYGSVVDETGKETTDNVETFVEIRKQQIMEASLIKHGGIHNKAGWDADMDRITAAVIRMELLGINCKHSLSLQLGNPTNARACLDSKGGIFVLYNYARLANLFNNLEKAITQGVYPAMPDVTAVDFGLLREEDEWMLMFNYILPYPELLADCVANTENECLHPSLPTHKLCQFLRDLSQDLSSYYSRIHILGESYPHLLPMMFARLWMLKGIQQVMANALALLNIKPISQM